MKVGTPAVIELKLTGSPPPSADWSLNRHRLPDDNRFNVSISNRMTSLMIYDVIRSDGGVYTVELVNELGRDKIDIEVVVFGKIYQSVR